MGKHAVPQNIIEKMSPSDRKAMGLSTRAEKLAKSEAKDEAEIQKEIENYLRLHGYEARTPHSITRGMPESGWYIHIHKAKRNPILLDLLILSNSGEYLELELKTETGRIRPEQEALIAYGASIARSAMEGIDIIREWHEKQTRNMQ